MKELKVFVDRDILNPHGSDETDVFFVKNHLTRCILNPHGSDETQIFKSVSITNIKSFLTHTVQMKPEITTPDII